MKVNKNPNIPKEDMGMDQYNPTDILGLFQNIFYWFIIQIFQIVLVGRTFYQQTF